jgi:AcrR family transcriptional regulator
MRVTSQNASTTPRLPQRQRGRLRVAALLQAAGAVFAEKGYDAATMTEIAARAGSSIGSLYQFFPTKDQLADALLARYADALYSRLADFEGEAVALGADELGARLFETLIDFRAEHPAFAALVEGGGPPPAFAAEVRTRLRQHVARILRQKAPDRPPASLEPVAVVVLQVMKAAVALNAEPALPFREAVLDELRAMLQLYLRNQLGPR